MNAVYAVGWWLVDHRVIATLGVWIGVGCVLAGIALRRHSTRQTPVDVPVWPPVASPGEQLPDAAQRPLPQGPAWRYEVTARRPAVRPVDDVTAPPRAHWQAYAIAPAMPPRGAETVD